MTISANIVASKVLHSKQGHQKTAGDGNQTCHPLHTPETRITSNPPARDIHTFMS